MAATPVVVLLATPTPVITLLVAPKRTDLERVNILRCPPAAAVDSVFCTSLVVTALVLIAAVVPFVVVVVVVAVFFHCVSTRAFVARNAF